MARFMGVCLGVFLTISVSSTSSFGQVEMTVQNTLSACDAPIGSSDHMYCLGLVSGTLAMMSATCRFIREGFGGNPIIASDGSEVTVGAALQAFKNWARDNPQEWSKRDNAGIVIALRTTFPCN